MKTKSLTSESESKIQNRDVDAPPRKKLKQARLPFQILTPSVESPLPPFKNNNKRKLETSDDVQIVKVVRPNESNELETKENVCSASVPSDCKKSTDIQTTKDVGGIDDTSKKSSEDEGNSNNIQKPEAGDKLENINSIQKPEAGDKLENKVDEIIEDNKLEKCKENSKVTNIENKCKGKEIPNKEVDIITVTDNEDSVSSPVNNKDIILSEKQKHLDKNAMVKNHTEDTTTLCVSLTDSEDSETEECEEISATMDDKANCHTENSDADESSTDDSPSPDLKSDKSDLTCHKTDNSDHTVSDAGKSVELSNEHSSDVHSLESTPIRRRSTEKVSPNPSLGSAQKFRKLTPKQLLKQAESAKKREEKERQKQEREKKRAEEKEEREKKKAEEKEEKLRQKQEKEEQKKKEKEEKEEQKRKEKEEKEEQKRKEKEEKEEQKKKEKEEKERKKQIELEYKQLYKQVKADMRLAPSKRTILTSELRKTLDKALEIQDQGKLYLEQLKNKEINPQSTTTTWALSDFKNDVVILEEDEITDNVADSVIEPYPATGQTHRPKLLQFWENRRPPYWGTWRKKSKSITAIKPFNKDELILMMNGKKKNQVNLFMDLMMRKNQKMNTKLTMSSLCPMDT
ncbi:hypothetical protein C0J52_23553 [Blattella germanica]|nr:hypothetical protein C0J52_23553 [Blattella germanica]